VGAYDGLMPSPDTPPIVMRFRTLDEAEGALDWIGLEFAEGDGWFEGELDEDSVERLEAMVAEADSPLEVRGLAALLLAQWRDATAPRDWRVAFPV
jgi:hypothetical protein